jgi:hypothetical protein
MENNRFSYAYIYSKETEKNMKWNKRHFINCDRETIAASTKKLS